MTGRAGSTTDRPADGGFALLLVLLLLLLLGALGAAVAVLAGGEAKMSRSLFDLESAQGVTEAAVYGEFNRMRQGLVPLPGVGDSTFLLQPPGYPAGFFRGYVHRTARNLLLVEVEGTSRNGRARRHLGLLARLADAGPAPAAPVAVLGPTSIGPQPAITGFDPLSEAGWECPELDTAEVLIELADSGLSDTSSCSTRDCLSGREAGFGLAGGALAEALGSGGIADSKAVPGGSYVASPATAAGRCLPDRGLNLGDPIDRSSPCFDYLPVVFVPGDLEIAGGEGQGTLVIDGDLTLSGGFSFYGIVWAKGGIKGTGAGGRVFGSVILGAAAVDSSRIEGELGIFYSSCAVLRALPLGSEPVLLESRFWANLADRLKW